jgi:diguanylate cyclase (GGDEF)-like protein
LGSELIRSVPWLTGFCRDNIDRPKTLRALFAAGLLLWLGSLVPNLTFAADSIVKMRALTPADSPPSIESILGGALDDEFKTLKDSPGHGYWKDYWLRLLPQDPPDAGGIPVVVLNVSRGLQGQVVAWRNGSAVPLPLATTLPGFLGTRDLIFVLPEGVPRSQALYAHMQSTSRDQQFISTSASTLNGVLAKSVENARVVSWTFGALIAVSMAALLIWFVLKDPLFILYAGLFTLQALYVAYLSGQGFEWPWLSFATPLNEYAWNVPIALSGAVACLFTREIADLRHFSPRVCKVYGWLAWAFVILAAANVAKYAGFLGVVNRIGNVMFVGVPIFTVVVCYMAWRRGNQAAGWFLTAWLLLESVTIAAAARFLVNTAENADPLYYNWLPFSMVAASILTALGVADRLRAQRLALTEAEKRAQTDPLTGVLNRRSLIERLDAACARARARGLPIALLFIDLDHFKQINDSFGHQAGDACLRAIIEPIHAELRQSDVIGRYGGEEFVVILSSADAAAAHPIAQRILERVADVRVHGYGNPIGLTCSIGIATSDTLGVWGEHLLARADAAVYVAKHAGRNRVHMAPPVAA